MNLRYWDKEAGEDPRKLAEEGVEVWAFCPGTNERYAVSNLGRVYSHVTESLLNPFPNGEYLAVSLSPGPYQGKTKLVHRVAVEAFDGPPPTEEHTDVRHNPDPTKYNNRLDNICWGTRSENMLDVLQAKQREAREEYEAEARAAGIDPQAPWDEKSLAWFKSEMTGWFKGYTLDDYLLRVGLEFLDEGKLNIADLTRLWKCSREVAENIVHCETRTHVPRPSKPKKQKRRSKQQKEAIMDLVREGKNAAEINEALGETLTAQDVYYYKTKVRREGA